MGISLLFGNGINRLNNTEASWENVLQQINAGNPTARELELVKHKPFALLYEEILLASVSVTGYLDEMPLKRRIASLVDGLQNNEFHQRVMASRVRHILTTNYDYNFEKSARQPFPRANIQVETKYSAYRRRSVGEKFVWHIHGEVMAPATITLGYDQYSGYLQKLRSHATAEREGEKGSPFKGHVLDFDQNEERPYSWLDIFFRDDMHIVGLGLDFTEIDLWWALTYKGRLRARGYPVGKTYFYDWHKDPVDEAVLAKRSLLAALSVEVRSAGCRNGFEPLYDKFMTKELGF